MTELILVRHGQAQSHAKDASSYDQLSDLGYTQARWLGEYMATTDKHFDKVYTGTLKRQIQTAASMGFAEATRDTRLNELDYFALAKALETQRGVPAPVDPSEFAAHLPEVIHSWSEGLITGVPETFQQFDARVSGLIDELCGAHGRVLLVTSGGVISMVIRHVLGLNNLGLAKVMLQVRNSSFHQVRFLHGQLMLGGYNATPHLDHPERTKALTYI